jgi:hypothetical protein
MLLMILLVIFLGPPEHGGRDNLGNDRLCKPAGSVEFFL